MIKTPYLIRLILKHTNRWLHRYMTRIERDVYSQLDMTHLKTVEHAIRISELTVLVEDLKMELDDLKYEKRCKDAITNSWHTDERGHI